MKNLLIAKSVLEMVAGLALVTFPSITLFLFIGQGLAEPGGIFLGRMCGAALIAVGISCWLAHYESQSSAATGLIWGLLSYDVCFTLLLLSARFRDGFVGIALWPVVALHSGLAVWSTVCLKKIRPPP